MTWADKKYNKVEEVLVDGKLIWMKRCRKGLHLYFESLRGCPECQKLSMKITGRNNYRTAHNIPLDTPVGYGRKTELRELQAAIADAQAIDAWLRGD